MALQAKRPHIAPQTQHGKRSGIFYEVFFRDILLQGRRQLRLIIRSMPSINRLMPSINRLIP